MAYTLVDIDVDLTCAGGIRKRWPFPIVVVSHLSRTPIRDFSIVTSDRPNAPSYIYMYTFCFISLNRSRALSILYI